MSLVSLHCPKKLLRCVCITLLRRFSLCQACPAVVNFFADPSSVRGEDLNTTTTSELKEGSLGNSSPPIADGTHRHERKRRQAFRNQERDGTGA